MAPVSSLTMMAMASLCEVMPRAARWRKPSSLGMLRLWLTGRMQPAAMMRLWLMMTAPSWRGEFLKKMFLMSSVLMLASMVSPDLTMSPSDISRSMMMSAPTMFLLMLSQASTMRMSCWSACSSSCPCLRFMRYRVRNFICRCEPRVRKKRLISS